MKNVRPERDSKKLQGQHSMGSPARFTALIPRIVMFMSMLVLIVYQLHFILPSPAQESPELISNPAVQTGLLVALGLLGALIGFWILFGDLVKQGEK